MGDLSKDPHAFSSPQPLASSFLALGLGRQQTKDRGHDIRGVYRELGSHPVPTLDPGDTGRLPAVRWGKRRV